MDPEAPHKRSEARARQLPGTPALVLSVAGVCLHFRGTERIRLAAPADCYAQFLRASPSEGPCIDVVEMEVLAGEVPRPDLLEPVFDTGGAWTLLRDERRFVFRMQPGPGDEEPLWSVTTDREVRHGRVYCSDRLLTPLGKSFLASNVVQYPLDQLVLMHVASARSAALLLHAAAGSLDGNGVLFAGPSGAGKSTITRLLAERGNMRFLSDDRVVVRRFGSKLSVFGTPWPGDAGVAINESVPLKAVCFLRHSDTTGLRELKPAEALEHLLPVVSVPWYQQDLADNALELCDFLIDRYPFFELAFRLQADEVAAVLDNVSRAA